MKIEFFFDCSSPWTYLAFESIQPLAAEFDAEIVWRPILVLFIVFRLIPPTPKSLFRRGLLAKRCIRIEDRASRRHRTGSASNRRPAGDSDWIIGCEAIRKRTDGCISGGQSRLSQDYPSK